MDLQVDLEKSIITHADTVVNPGAVVVESIDANLALVAMFGIFICHRNTLEANHLMTIAL